MEALSPPQRLREQWLTEARSFQDSGGQLTPTGLEAIGWEVSNLGSRRLSFRASLWKGSHLLTSGHGAGEPVLTSPQEWTRQFMEQLRPDPHVSECSASSSSVGSSPAFATCCLCNTRVQIPCHSNCCHGSSQVPCTRAAPTPVFPSPYSQGDDFEA